MSQGNAGTKIVLVRHAMPVIDPARPAGEWMIAEEAVGSTLRLAGALRQLGVDGVVSSPEPKAASTARLIAGRLDLPLLQDESLGEQGGDTIPWYAEPEEFTSAVRKHFERADRIVFGEESSADAGERFAGGVECSLSAFRMPVLVTHGRIMCGYLARCFGIDPMGVWATLRLPDAFVLDMDSRNVTRIDVEEG